MKKTILLAILLLLLEHKSLISNKQTHAAPPNAKLDQRNVEPSHLDKTIYRDLEDDNQQDKQSLSEWLNVVNKRNPFQHNASVGNNNIKDNLTLRSLDAIPFLIQHIWDKREALLSYSGDPNFETHPYLEAIVIQYREAGIAAILDFVASKSERDLTDEQLGILAYGILIHCGFDKPGREFASKWIDFTERRQGQTGALKRLRDRLPLTERSVR